MGFRHPEPRRYYRRNFAGLANIYVSPASSSYWYVFPPTPMSQKMNRAANCMMRGPEVAVGVPKALSPVTKGIKHCSTPAPQDAAFVETANCCVCTAVTLPRLRTLKASPLNSSLARSFLMRNARVSRVSSATVLGKVKVLRPIRLSIRTRLLVLNPLSHWPDAINFRFISARSLYFPFDRFPYAGTGRPEGCVN